LISLTSGYWVICLLILPVHRETSAEIGTCFICHLWCLVGSTCLISWTREKKASQKKHGTEEWKSCRSPTSQPILQLLCIHHGTCTCHHLGMCRTHL
jgi:hypothetical protein